MYRWSLWGEDLRSWQKYFCRTRRPHCLTCPLPTQERHKPQEEAGVGSGSRHEGVFLGTVRGKSQDTLNSWKRSIHSKGLKANSSPFWKVEVWGAMVCVSV